MGAGSRKKLVSRATLKGFIRDLHGHDRSRGEGGAKNRYQGNFPELRTFRDRAFSLRTSDSILLLSNFSSNSSCFVTADVLLLSLLVVIYCVEIFIYDFIRQV